MVFLSGTKGAIFWEGWYIYRASMFDNGRKKVTYEASDLHWIRIYSGVCLALRVFNVAKSTWRSAPILEAWHARLRNAQERLRETNEHLEERVQERTFEYIKANQRLKWEGQERRRAEEKKEKLIVELQKALANIRTLQGLIPICSKCKKIRDDKGYWIQIERYIHEHSGADFSHGICPDCARKLYPGFYKKETKNKE